MKTTGAPADMIDYVGQLAETGKRCNVWTRRQGVDGWWVMFGEAVLATEAYEMLVIAVATAKPPVVSVEIVEH